MGDSWSGGGKVESYHGICGWKIPYTFLLVCPASYRLAI